MYFAEYTKCNSCQLALLECDCNCPYCGKRDNCHCELRPITWESKIFDLYIVD